MEYISGRYLYTGLVLKLAGCHTNNGYGSKAGFEQLRYSMSYTFCLKLYFYEYQPEDKGAPDRR